MAVAVGRKLLEHHAWRHWLPLAVDQRTPGAIIGLVGPRLSAVTLDTVRRAVTARVASPRLLEFLVPVMVLGVSFAMMAALCKHWEVSREKKADN